MGSTDRNSFNPVPMVLVVLAVLMLVSLRFQSHIEEVSIPRYCENKTQTLRLLGAVLTKERPAGDEARRPYLVAAKLLHLLPQKNNETIIDYLNRVELYLLERCPGHIISRSYLAPTVYTPQA